MLTTGTYWLTGTRNGKGVRRKVTAKQCADTNLFWIKDAEGKSFFGTTTGYHYSDSKGSLITSYRGAILLVDVLFEKIS